MWDKSPISEIQVIVIDTRQFPKNTFVKDRDYIEALFPNVDIFPKEKFVFNLRKRQTKRGKDYYFGEYLSQGDLNLEGRYVQTTIDKLIKLGLFDVQDAFGNKKGGGSGRTESLSSASPLGVLFHPRQQRRRKSPGRSRSHLLPLEMTGRPL